MLNIGGKKIKLETLISTLEQESISFEIIKNDNWEESYTFASIKNIIQNGIYFFENTALIKDYNIQNSILIVSEVIKTNNNLIVVTNPQLVHYLLNSKINKTILFGISNSAKISSEAVLGKNIYIGENSVIGKCIIEDNVVIKHNVVIEDNVIIKQNTFIDNNSSIGAGGIAWIWDSNGNRIIQPQIGGVLIEKDCILGTDITIVRGSLSESTFIGEGTVIAHGTKIGHGAIINKYVHIANNVSIAGNATIGERCFLGSASVISSNIKVQDNCIIGAGAVVAKNVDENFVTLAGVPAKIIKKDNYIEKPNGVPKPFKK